jgi:hypothetical protein
VSGSPIRPTSGCGSEILAQEQTGELLAAWIAKEEFRYLLSLPMTQARTMHLAKWEPTCGTMLLRVREQRS